MVPASISSELQDAFSAYQRKREAWISRSGLSVSLETEPTTTFFAFDYMIYNGTQEDISQGAHAELVRTIQITFFVQLCEFISVVCEALKLKNIRLAYKDDHGRGGITSPILEHKEQGSPLTRLALLIHAVPACNLFEKRIALFAHGSGERSSYLSQRVKET